MYTHLIQVLIVKDSCSYVFIRKGPTLKLSVVNEVFLTVNLF